MRHLRFKASPKSISIALENGIFTQANTIQWAYPLAHLESKIERTHVKHCIPTCARQEKAPPTSAQCAAPLSNLTVSIQRTQNVHRAAQTPYLCTMQCAAASMRTWEESNLHRSVLHASGIKDNAPPIRRQVLLQPNKGRHSHNEWPLAAC